MSIYVYAPGSYDGTPPGPRLTNFDLFERCEQLAAAVRWYATPPPPTPLPPARPPSGKLLSERGEAEKETQRERRDREERERERGHSQ